MPGSTAPDQAINVGIEGGRIVVLQDDDLATGHVSIEAGGAFISPAFVDPHFHLENALLNDTVNTSGTLREAINIYAEVKREMSRENIVERATSALRLALGNGTLWMRNNVDIDQIAQAAPTRCDLRGCATGLPAWWTCRSSRSPSWAWPVTPRRWI